MRLVGWPGSGFQVDHIIKIAEEPYEEADIADAIQPQDNKALETKARETLQLITDEFQGMSLSGQFDGFFRPELTTHKPLVRAFGATESYETAIALDRVVPQQLL